MTKEAIQKREMEYTQVISRLKPDFASAVMEKVKQGIKDRSHHPSESEEERDDFVERIQSPIVAVDW